MSLVCISAFLRRRLRAPLGDVGYAALELVVLTPVLLMVALLVVGFGRLTHAQDVVQQEAAATARDATLDGDAGQAKAEEITADQALAGVCTNANPAFVDTSDFNPGGSVTVTVRCTVNVTDLPFSFHHTVKATATSPLEQFRQLDTVGADG